MKRITLLLDQNVINGPFNLVETITSGQTSKPILPRVGKGFWDAIPTQDSYMKVEIFQEGSIKEPILRVDVVGEKAILEENLEGVTDYLITFLRLEDDLKSFYRHFKEDSLSKTFKGHQGLRLTLAPNPFESLICSICSQNTSVKQWNKMIRLIKKRYGKREKLSDKTHSHFFPEPRILAQAHAEELRKCEVGYRAEYIIEASRLVYNGGLNLEEIRKIDYEKAHERLTEIRGIGPKVADCFLLYGLGFNQAAPVDFWVHRIVQKLYFTDQPITRGKARDFLQRRFGCWAGYAQLYLFNYARKGFRE